MRKAAHAASAAAPRRSKILLVDDHPVVRESLTLRIAQEGDLQVCAAVGDAAQAVKAVDRHKPDLVVLDMNLPDGHGLELIKEIRNRAPKALMLVFSMHDEHLYGERALRAGAQGYVMKSEPPDKVIEALRRVLSGRVAISEDLSHRLLAGAVQNDRPVESPVQLLSDRELEVFQLIGKGHGTKEIADRLHRGVKTIDTYRLRIKEKLGITSATELVAAAARWLAEHP